MPELVWVCCGGALGSAARYLTGVWAARALGPTFPYGTLAVNLLGSFVISIVLKLALTGGVSPSVRLFLATGVLGGFTTYSSFNYETLRLVEEGSFGLAAANVVATVVGCLLAGGLGLLLAGRMAGASG